MRAGDSAWRPGMGQKRESRGTSRLHSSTSQPVIHLSSEHNVGQDGPTMMALPCGVLSHIFEGLGPRDLASASCVCKAWRHLVALEAAANLVWRSFYSARWQLSGARWPRPPAASDLVPCIHAPSSTPITPSDLDSAPAPSSGGPEMRWQWAYGTKMLRLRSWSGRYSSDQVVGHRSAVRATRLLPSSNLLATASLDRTVRLWDLRSGLPVACSRPHGGTVRCLALDTHLLASGCSDNLVRVWRPRPAGTALSLFDISSKPYLLRGHTGPVSCLALDEAASGSAASHRSGGGGSGGGGTIFSGSWDCTVRIWRQGCGHDGGDEDEDGDCTDASSGSGIVAAGGSSDEGSGSCGSGGGAATATGDSSGEGGGWSCAGVLQYSDWVYCCAVRGGNLLVAAGSEVVVTDAATGRAVRRFAGLHDGGAVACLEGCRSGRLMFTASGDGLLLAHDLRMKQGSRVLWHHNAAVTGLSFEDPWLASASADGCIILQDSEQALAGGGSPQRALNSSCRALNCPTGQPALCLDLADQWLAAGTDGGVVRLWDFTGAAAAAERATAARAARGASKASRAAARQEHRQHRPRHCPQPPGGPAIGPADHMSTARDQATRGPAAAIAGSPPPPPPFSPRGTGEGGGTAAATDGGHRRGGGPSVGGGGGGAGSSQRGRHGPSSQPQHHLYPSRGRVYQPGPGPLVTPGFRYVASGHGSVAVAASTGDWQQQPGCGGGSGAKVDGPWLE